jgi:hypothetical protein
VRSSLSGRGTHSSRSSSMRFGHLAAEFQGGNGLLSRDRGEAVEKLVSPSPASRWSYRDFTGTRVPTKTGVPPRMSGSL